MNKRYIDFVPVKNSQASSRVKSRVADNFVDIEMPESEIIKTKTLETKTVDHASSSAKVLSPGRRQSVSQMPEIPSRSERLGHSKRVMHKSRTIETVETKDRVNPEDRVASSGSTKLGVIEDLGSGNENLDARRTSDRPHFVVEQSEIRAAKAKKIGNKEASTVESQPVVNRLGEDKRTYRTPRDPFINQDKVKKRPLSKNVYRSRPVVGKEEAKGPVTIITKPEKDTKLGLVVTIIITIVLGAAAGAVAFWILPK